MSKEQLYTQEGYQKLIDEFDFLTKVRREEIKVAIAEARSFGDLSENAEYDEARNEQAKTEARIKELEELIRNAKVHPKTEPYPGNDVFYAGKSYCACEMKK